MPIILLAYGIQHLKLTFGTSTHLALDCLGCRSLFICNKYVFQNLYKYIQRTTIKYYNIQKTVLMAEA